MLLMMVETIGKIQTYTSDIRDARALESDGESFDATLMNFIVLGESIAKLSDHFKERYPHIEWRKIYAFRNILAHDYFGVLPDEVWEIIEKKLPALKKQLGEIVDGLPS